MSANLRYWLWLQAALGEGARIKEIIREFGSAKGLYESNILQWRMSSSLVPKQVSRLESIALDDVEEIIYNCRVNGWQIIDYEDERYPERLRVIDNPPAVLYIDGVFPDIDASVVIGIVGTRKASEYAVKVTQLMSSGVAQCGAVVVSGGALGVDTAAHRGAIICGGKTVCVLGCGFGTNYLIENKSLRESVKNNGALVTEFPPFTKAAKYTFPLRNRIISGLSLGVLVVEAGMKSGSLITANLALEQGRDVYAVPCSILSPQFAGTNKLINDGAVVAVKPADLLYPYAERYNLDLTRIKSVEQLMNETADKSANVLKSDKKFSFEALEQGRKKREKRHAAALALKGDALSVYQVLTDEFQHIDVISEKCSLPPSVVLSSLTMLEIADLAVSAGGKRYKQS